MSRGSALLRWLLWRCTFAFFGGMYRDGERLPRGGFVVIANHQSHADAPALLAALGPRRRVRVAAAADYWFNGGLRARMCQWLVGGFAVRRNGGGASDLAAMAEFIRRGGVVVLFPEGTRSRDGVLGEFHRGAFRLAELAGAPLVPIGIAGTRQLLPVHGTPCFGAVRVRVGGSLQSTTPPDRARAQVAGLAAGTVGRGDSRLRRRVRTFAASRVALLVVAVWAGAEALSWPFVPELLLGVVLLAAPRAAWRLVPLAAAASVAGSLLGYGLAAHDHHLPQPLTTPRMYTAVAATTAAEGAGAVRHQAWSGIPVKVYAAEAGREHVSLTQFALGAARARGGRILAVGALLALIGAAFSRAPRLYPALVGFGLTTYAVGLGRVIAHWS
ncbi:MAG: 1-acyl-sn-glycerol-3-phosphate acyltransferase [Frankiales bacterium]|nr:1-acyl-sn-glycerol-3-phosphate acyltransferase [Frankiales bacterium]